MHQSTYPCYLKSTLYGRFADYQREVCVVDGVDSKFSERLWFILKQVEQYWTFSLGIKYPRIMKSNCYNHNHNHHHHIRMFSEILWSTGWVKLLKDLILATLKHFYWYLFIGLCYHVHIEEKMYGYLLLYAPNVPT